MGEVPRSPTLEMRKEPRNAKTVALLRWTGEGSLADLMRSVSRVLVGRRFRIERVGETISISGGEQSTAARLLAYLPGVDWIGLGYTTDGRLEEILKVVEVLGKRYLRRNSTFRVRAESAGETLAESDITGAANSRLLDLGLGVRTDEKRPEVTFRVALDRRVGAAGVEIRRGVGGVPTSHSKAYCLVSGGMHSSVLAWMTALAGFSIDLVHVRMNNESAIEASRLYSELSHRIDPTSLALTLLTGAKGSSTAEVLAGWLKGGRRNPVFSGLHLECRREGRRWRADSRVLTPLLLMPESEFSRLFDSLGLRGYFDDGDMLSKVRSAVPGRYRTTTFGGVRADLHRVVDSLS